MKYIEALLLRGTHFNPTRDELKRISEHYPEVNVSVKEQTEYTKEDVLKAHIIVGIPKLSYLKEAHKLVWLQTPSAGIQKFSDKNLYSSKNVILTNASGIYGRQISDHVIGSIIAHNHNFYRYKEQMKQKQWKEYIPNSNIWENTILIFGYGDIGTHIAKKAKALDMHVIVVTRTKRENETNVDEFYTTDQLDDVIHRANYLVLSSASTSETEQIIDKKRIQSLPQNAYIINIARGNLIDEKALVEALQHGHLSGASLDVTEKEPLDEKSPLWELENVLITPHCSGLSKDVPSLVFDLFYSNLSYFLKKEEMMNVVDFDKSY